MKSAWGPDLCDMAAWNTGQVEGVDLFDFEEMLAEDIDCMAWDEFSVTDSIDDLEEEF
jgi:hypothetical protein